MSKRSFRDKNMSIDQEFEKIMKHNLSDIQEEEKESSYNLVGLNPDRDQFEKKRSSTTVKEPVPSISPFRDPLTFSKETIDNQQAEATKGNIRILKFRATLAVQG